MSNRSIKVRLSAEVTDFQRQMAKASRSLDDLVKKSGDSSGVAQTTMGRLVQSARLQSDAWNTAGGAMLGVGGAITGINIAVAKTGIEYNTLQQRSRAALGAILGGSKEANAQMDKLDEFARTSPFAKDVFIQAQQQMLGFGIEAQKVIPYLSSINEAVAATGGSNQDIAELTRIFSQVSAAGKITAVDLMQFGQRGVDAATLIGSQMGKTGAQIRDDISNGTLDAGAALDALAAGMQDRFGGASEGIKNTMTGAIDRVKAAWRDLSSSLMEGAVGTGGGGWLVGLTNGAADLLRAVESLPAPVKNVSFTLGSLGGVGLAAAGGLAIMLPKALEVRTAFKELAQISPNAVTGFKNVGKAAGVAAAALTAITIAGQVAASMQELAVGADVAAAAMTRLEAGTGNLDEVFKRVDGSEIAPGIDSLADAFLRLNMASADADGVKFLVALEDGVNNLAGVGSVTDDLRKQFALLDAQLSSMETDRAMESFSKIRDEFNKVRTEFEAAGRPIEELNALFPDYAAKVNMAAASAGMAALEGEALTDAMSGLNPELNASIEASKKSATAQNEFEAAMAGSTDAAQAQAEAVAETVASINDYYNAAMSAADAAIAVEQSFDDATAAAEENGKTLDRDTEAGRKNEKALLGIATAATRHAESMATAGATTEEITAATQRARDQFVTAAKAMGLGSDAANALADEYGLIPSDVATRVTQPGMGTAQDDAQALRELLARLPANVRSQIKVVADLSGYYDANRVLNSINGRVARASVVIKQYGQAAVASGGYMGDFARLADGGMARRDFTAGGSVRGPGTPTSDSIAAWLSDKEFVIRAAAVQRIGVDRLRYMNATGEVPRFADGGPVSRFVPSGLASSTGPSRATLSPADVDRIAAAVRDGAASGTASGITARDAAQASGHRRIR